MQEAPQWFSLCGANALPGIPQINRWFIAPKYREWVDMMDATWMWEVCTYVWDPDLFALFTVCHIP